MELQTERLIIRRVEPSDASALFDAMECPEVHLMYSNGFNSIRDVNNYIDVITKEYCAGAYKTLAIAEKGGNTLIGSITLDVASMFSRVEISYWINRRYRNIGYATEAVKELIRYCFSSLESNRIQAITSNPASEKVLIKAGMKYEGTLRQYVGFNGMFKDMKMFSILRSDLALLT